MPSLAHIALVVRDHDEALAFYVAKLGFELVEDRYQPAQDKRWVTIRPPGAPLNATTILRARASTEHQARYIGDQVGGRVLLFLATDVLARDHTRLTAVGMKWARELARRLRLRLWPGGGVAAWRDLYGNLWDLVEFAPRQPFAVPSVTGPTPE